MFLQCHTCILQLIIITKERMCKCVVVRLIKSFSDFWIQSKLCVWLGLLSSVCFGYGMAQKLSIENASI